MKDLVKQLRELISKSDVSSKDEMLQLLSKIQDDFNDLKYEYSDLEYKYRNLEDEIDYSDNGESIYTVGTDHLMAEIKDRHFSIIASSNLYDDFKVEILKQMYDKYNLTELQQIYEGLDRK